jgi:hypothetical protein
VILITLNPQEKKALMVGNAFPELLPGLYVLDIQSTMPVSALALRTVDGGNGGMSFTPLPVFQQEPNENMSIFPLFADGGGYSTEFLLLNRSGSDISGVLSLFKQDGNALRALYR